MRQLVTEECELPLILNRFWEIGCKGWFRASRLIQSVFYR